MHGIAYPRKPGSQQVHGVEHDRIALWIASTPARRALSKGAGGSGGLICASISLLLAGYVHRGQGPSDPLEVFAH